ncbi:MAG: hypothetical protein AAGF23_27780, partial [Acidobacteriota bacterium]
IWLPDDASTATLSFRLQNSSPAGSNGALTVRFLDNATDDELTAVVIDGTFIDTDLGISHAGYRKYVLDLTPLVGADFRMEVESTHTGDPALLFLDNVGLTHTVFAGGGGGGGLTD